VNAVGRLETATTRGRSAAVTHVFGEVVSCHSVTRDRPDPSTEDIEHRIQQVGRYSRFVKTGLGVIVAAFGLSVVGRLPTRLDSIPSAVDAVLLPLIFVGMGLLFEIGMHLYLLHPNLVKQLRMDQVSDGERES
jgi:hypothetical protein